MNAERNTERAYAYLNRVIEGTHPEIVRLVDEYGAEDVAERIKARRALPNRLLASTESRAYTDTSAQDVADAAALGYRLVHPGCAEWPVEKFAAFDALEATDRSDAPPLALWVCGRDLRETAGESVALVGTRASTRYGVDVAAQLAGQMASNRVTVVSGGALGIDAAAHRAALEAGGVTIAVAACGPGVAYPSAHRQLFSDIARSGCLVSEYPPAVRPARHRFLTRNRLVAALADATIVVEAGWRSGARNTASWATRMNRPLGAVPGPVTSPATTGSHDLIRTGQAVLVTNADNVFALYRAVGSVDEDRQLELEWAKSATQGLSRNELSVFDALNVSSPVGVDVVSARAGFSIELATFLLLDLQKRGLVRRSEGGWSRAAEAA
nr:DNA-processing protein DprA [Corynebacterium lactis]